MPLSSRKKLILAKRETVYATDPVPVFGTDAVLVRDVALTPLDAQYVDRALLRPYYGRSEQLPTTAWYRLEFEIELAAFPTKGTPVPGVSALLRACGLAETIVAATSVAYSPVSSALESVTIYCNVDGVLHKLTGARGSLSLDLTANQIPTMKFTFVGIWSPATDVAAGVPTFTQQKPVVVNAANTTALTLLGVTSAVLQSLSLDLANQLATRALVNGPAQVLITDRAPAGSIEIEMTTVAVKDWFTTIRAATKGALGVTHGPAGNQVVIAAPAVQLTEPRYGDSDGTVMLQMSAQITPSSGNDELTLTFQ